MECTSVSNARSFPVIAFLYSTVMDLIVTSGGSKFVIEAPYLVPAAIDVGADLGTVISAYQLGDGVSNLLTPFFCLPYMANFDIEFNKVIPYSLIAGLLCWVAYSVLLDTIF